MTTPPIDPLSYMQSLWGALPAPLPGFVPTTDVSELEKRIADLKAVESWLQASTHMLRMTIQALEVQRATLAVLNAQAGGDASAPTLPTFDPASWPLNMLQATAQFMGASSAQTEADTRSTHKARQRRSGR